MKQKTRKLISCKKQIGLACIPYFGWVIVLFCMIYNLRYVKKKSLLFSNFLTFLVMGISSIFFLLGAVISMQLPANMEQGIKTAVIMGIFLITITGAGLAAVFMENCILLSIERTEEENFIL